MNLGIKYKILIKILKTLSSTWRYEIKGEVPTQPGIVAFWHGYMLAVWKYFSKYHPYAIVSPSKDGEILSNLLSEWNYSLIRGSSRKKGKQALQDIVENATKNLVLITPDGPTGKINKFKAGAVVASQRCGSPVYLCRVKIKNMFVFHKSWDKFKFPLPFTKIILEFSNQIFVDKDLDREQVNDVIYQCEKFLNS